MFKTLEVLLVYVLLFGAVSCQQSKQKLMDQSQSIEKVSYEEQGHQSADGWISLSEGDALTGWHTYNKAEATPGWQIEDGIISFDKSRGEGGDLLTDETYENFELSLEWKIQDCGNSGIFWNVIEDEKYQYPFLTGPEMQVLDNSCHPDAKIKTHRAGDLYDMIETSVVNVKPAGEWNSIKLRSDKGQVSFWQNDVKVVTFTMHTPQWDEMVANSKFASMPDFGKAKRGHIALQDHGDKVWFRNIQIVRL